VSKQPAPTPVRNHRPIMVEEVLRYLRPEPGEVAVDCTLGGGGHARRILERLLPGGRLIGLDVDARELPRVEAELRAAGFGPETFTTRHASFANLARVLAGEGLAAVDLVVVDLGISSMQIDDPERGFSYKGVGPLDMRMNRAGGERATDLLGRLDVEQVTRLLDENADEPHARLIAILLKEKPLTTTHAAERRCG
jgi:16S rRNA (cytosine1402-N4)-methyltransferase